LRQAAKRETGTVKFYDQKRGFGFLPRGTVENAGIEDLFMGDELEFECISDQDGRAIALRLRRLRRAPTEQGRILICYDNYGFSGDRVELVRTTGTPKPKAIKQRVLV
jgi:cold shock CspA family protein